MQHKFLSQVLFAAVAAAACTGRPCNPKDEVLKILLEPAVSDTAYFFCALHNAPKATETVTPTETVSAVTTRIVPGETFTVTEPFTVSEDTTVFLTNYYTVTTSSEAEASTLTLYKRWGEGAELGPLNALKQFPESRISSACSCLVPTPPGPVHTETVTASTVTETEFTTVTIPGDEQVTTLTEPTTISMTTTVETALPTFVAAPPPVDVCADKPRKMCCQTLYHARDMAYEICGHTVARGEYLGGACIEIAADQECPYLEKNGYFSGCCQRFESECGRALGCHFRGFSDRG